MVLRNANASGSIPPLTAQEIARMQVKAAPVANGPPDSQASPDPDPSRRARKCATRTGTCTVLLCIVSVVALAIFTGHTTLNTITYMSQCTKVLFIVHVLRSGTAQMYIMMY